MCRKQQGAAFRSRARVRQSDLKWVQGEDLVRFYESTPGTFRGLYSVCGSPIVNKFDARSQSAADRPAAVTEYGIARATLDAIRVCDLWLTYSLRAKRRGSWPKDRK